MNTRAWLCPWEMTLRKAAGFCWSESWSSRITRLMRKFQWIVVFASPDVELTIISLDCQYSVIKQEEVEELLRKKDALTFDRKRLTSQLRYVNSKCTRESTFRKSLQIQKMYLLCLIGKFKQTWVFVLSYIIIQKFVTESPCNIQWKRDDQSDCTNGLPCAGTRIKWETIAKVRRDRYCGNYQDEVSPCYSFIFWESNISSSPRIIANRRLAENWRAVETARR